MIQADRSSRNDNRPLPIRKNKKVIAMMNASSGIVMTNFDTWRTKMYVYRNLNKNLKDKPCNGKQNLQLPKALLLMTIRPACLTL